MPIGIILDIIFFVKSRKWTFGLTKTEIFKNYRLEMNKIKFSVIKNIVLSFGKVFKKILQVFKITVFLASRTYSTLI